MCWGGNAGERVVDDGPMYLTAPWPGTLLGKTRQKETEEKMKEDMKSNNMASDRGKISADESGR